VCPILLPNSRAFPPKIMKIFPSNICRLAVKFSSKAKKLYSTTCTHGEHEPGSHIPPPPMRLNRILPLEELGQYPAPPNQDKLHLSSPFFSPTLAEENSLVEGIAAVSAALSALPSPPPKPLLGAHVAVFTRITAAVRKWRLYTIPVLVELYNFVVYPRPYNKRKMDIGEGFNAIRVYALMMAHVAHVKRRFEGFKPGNERLLEGPWWDLLMVEEQLLKIFVLGTRPTRISEGGGAGFARGCVGLVPWYGGDGSWEVREEIGYVNRRGERGGRRYERILGRGLGYARSTEGWERASGDSGVTGRFPVVPRAAQLDAGWI